MHATMKNLSLDWILIVAVTGQLIFGIIFVSSISSSYSEPLFGHAFVYTHSYLLELAFALIVSIFVFRYWSVAFIQNHAIWFLIASFMLIILTLLPITGYNINGSSRHINIGITTIFALPPALLLFNIFSSHFLPQFYAHNKLRSKHTIKIVITVFTFLFLIKIQPNLSSVIILICLIAIMLLASRLYKATALFASVVIAFLFISIITKQYYLVRHMSFLDPFQDMFSLGYQLSLGLSAIGGGDLWGSGFGEGIIVRSRFVGAFENFTFSSIVEEFGFMGILVLIFSTALVFWRCLRLFFKLIKTEHKFEAFLVLGISSWIFLTGLIHMALNLGLVPTSNVPLPFISYAPSYLFSFIIGITIILKIGADTSTIQTTASVPRKVITTISILIGIITISAYNATVLDENLDYHYNNRVGAIKSSKLSKIRNEQLTDAYKKGKIKDRYGKILAKYVPTYHIWINPKRWDSNHPNWEEMLAILNLDRNKTNITLNARKKQQKSFFYLKRKVDFDIAEAIKKLDIKGVYHENDYAREYPAGESVAQLIGITDIDNKGLEGLELQFEEIMLPKRISGSSNQNIQLSIDLRIQKLAFRALTETVQASQAESGTVIIIDSPTGEILAMANAPSYDNNRRESISPKTIKNRAITDVFEPGDVLMPLTILAALESGRYKPESIIDTSPSLLEIAHHKLKDTKNFGQVSMKVILQDSSKIGMSKIALDLPVGTLPSIFEKMGLLKTTSIELPGEISGLMNKQSDSRPVERAALSYGRGIAVTAIQLAQVYSIIANNGLDTPLTILKKGSATNGKQIISLPVVEQLKQMLSVSNDQQIIGKQGVVQHYNIFSQLNNDEVADIYAGMNSDSEKPLAIVVIINNPKITVTEQHSNLSYSQNLASKIMETSLKLLVSKKKRVDDENLY